MEDREYEEMSGIAGVFLWIVMMGSVAGAAFLFLMVMWSQL